MALRRERAKLIHSEPVGTVAAAAGSAVQHRQQDQRFIIMYQEALERLAGEADLTLTQLRVLLKLMGVMDYQNYLVINQAGIAQDLRMTRPQVNKAIRALVERNLLSKGPRFGARYTYRLTPAVAWRGRVAQGKVARRRTLKDGRLRVIEGGAAE